jgi:hypothetical protein
VKNIKNRINSLKPYLPDLDALALPVPFPLTLASRDIRRLQSVAGKAARCKVYLPTVSKSHERAKCYKAGELLNGMALARKNKGHGREIIEVGDNGL